jgi:hypothetical protein
MAWATVGLPAGGVAKLSLFYLNHSCLLTLRTENLDCNPASVIVPVKLSYER